MQKIYIVFIVSCLCAQVLAAESTGQPGENLLPNPDFRMGTNGWSCSDGRVKLVEVNGKKVVEVTADTTKNPNTVGRFYTNPTILNTKVYWNRQYRLSAEIMTKGDALASLNITYYDDKKAHINWSYSNSGGDASRDAFRTITLDQQWLAQNAAYASVTLRVHGRGSVLVRNMSWSFQTKDPMFYIRRDADAIDIRGIIDPADAQPGQRVRAELLSPTGEAVVSTSEQFPIENARFNFRVDVSRFSYGIYRFRIQLLRGKNVYKEYPLSFTPGIDDEFPETSLYSRLRNSEIGVDVREAAKPEPTEQQTKKGLILFNRPEPRWIQPDSIPLPEETLPAVQRTVVAGDKVVIPFAVFPLRDIKNIAVRAKIGDSSIPAEVNTIRWWHQQERFDSRPSDTYIRRSWVVPELIEPQTKLDAHAGKVEMYAVECEIPADVKPGQYTGTIDVYSGETKLAAVPLTIDVSPAKLTAGDDTVFGIYVDDVRYQCYPEWYTDERIHDELLMLRQAGFNSLFLGFAPPNTPIKRIEGKAIYDLTFHNRLLAQARRAGFVDKPMILNPYVLDRVLGLQSKGREYAPEEKKIVEDVFKQFRAAAKKNDWPEMLIHGVDEASHGERLDESFRRLQTARKMGFKTSATTYTYALDGGIGKLIDYPLYSMPGFWSIGNAKELERLQRQCRQNGSTFWFYGSGCYANATPGDQFRIVRQEGCLSENRYMNGLFTFRTGAKGAWAWTLARHHGNP
ncbi:MAG: hypothetical protein JXA11_12515, partial [Phycisphaerae bacterium]|nr:hypothetical protein [Phycisphaerae bacterium]